MDTINCNTPGSADANRRCPTLETDCNETPVMLASDEAAAFAATEQEMPKEETAVVLESPEQEVSVIVAIDDDPNSSAAETIAQPAVEPEEEATESTSEGTEHEEANTPSVVTTEPLATTTNDTPAAQEEPEIPHLPLPEPMSDYRGTISAFAFSQQGESHVKKDVPCQDRSGIRFIGDSLVVAAVADGVGSCALSEFGADAAVMSSLDFLQTQLEPKLGEADFALTDKLMGQLLRDMMMHAYNSVVQRSAEMEQMLYSLQSTLTVAVYDGETLYFAHAGDDGIVVLTKDGQYAMATARHKGEEASSVYPLQSQSTWQYGKVSNAVAFVLATDGVLDAFVRGETEGCRVYYPFVEPAFYTPAANAEDAAAICADWYEFMKAPNYRASVTDDLSLACVVNQAAIQTSVRPTFDIMAWNQKSREYDAKRRAALYPPKQPVAQPSQPAQPAQSAPQTTQPAPNPVQSTPSAAQNAPSGQTTQVKQPTSTAQNASSPQKPIHAAAAAAQPGHKPNPTSPTTSASRDRDSMMENLQLIGKGLSGVFATAKSAVSKVVDDTLQSLREQQKQSQSTTQNVQTPKPNQDAGTPAPPEEQKH